MLGYAWFALFPIKENELRYLLRRFVEFRLRPLDPAAMIRIEYLGGVELSFIAELRPCVLHRVMITNHSKERRKIHVRYMSALVNTDGSAEADMPRKVVITIDVREIA